MHRLDRALLRRLQDGIGVDARPFAAVAAELDCPEDEVIERLDRMLAQGLLTRFGPMYDAARLGGEFMLCAMAVPAERLDEVAEAVNAHPEVAHNYEREHRYNLWFVVATEHAGEAEGVVRAIEDETGLAVLRLPKEAEYGIGLRFEP
ncbi:Lrp/AsnC family transcriptional regulator [Inmirania thermothiophila]|uniref:siroheme decarboxylase n=1 Tax=Inmirania thermothiophila TaxID=1750597 RepID=A0A3N1XS87_9GAMM|nr:Lrp/AsnC family transcriptional regulator [Inmirania thermothiophila]ROR29523.1 AsnC family transcriptional regulator [Inmirania thermothiophila]